MKVVNECGGSDSCSERSATPAVTEDQRDAGDADAGDAAAGGGIEEGACEPAP